MMRRARVATIGLLSLISGAAWRKRRCAFTPIARRTIRSSAISRRSMRRFPSFSRVALDRTLALQLSTMPLSCMDHPQPRPNTVPYIWEATYTPAPDYETTRAFYGCYDWHSAVNSAWTLVRILKTFPDLPTAPAIRQKLNDHFGASNIAGDLQFFKGAGTFELPYGYAWLLRLQFELRSWADSDATRWAANMQPMATYMSERMTKYLKELQQPVRTGVHPNTAMAMDNALGYARAFDPALEAEIRASADRLFKRDIHCNTAVEPARATSRRPVSWRRPSWDSSWIATRSFRGSTHSCRNCTPRSFVRSRGDWVRSS